MSQWGEVQVVRREVRLAGVGSTLVDARVLPHYDGPFGCRDGAPDSHLVTSLTGVHLELSFNQRQEAAELITQMLDRGES